ncbi:MAG: alanine racemase, partial [Pseudomonadales bacterium]|nr:alanine racemase [Pseudomonadales bacterium]
MKNSLSIEPVESGAYYRSLVEQYGSALLLLDCNAVREQYRQLREALPGVDFFYAIKSLPHPDVLDTLVQEGAGFDIATSGEIEIVRQLPISPRRTIHTHPIKRNKDIRDALRFGCTTFVVDNIEEIKKFADFKHRVGLLLRICFRNPNATVDLSKKFGCPPEEALTLLHECKRLGLHVKGFSFHVGSQCQTAESHVEAIKSCKALFERIAEDDTIDPPSILDIGGGFPVNYNDNQVSILDFCQPIRAALAELPPYVRAIAEPGRF